MISSSMIVENVYNIKAIRSDKYDYSSTVIDADVQITQNTYIVLDTQNTLIDVVRPREIDIYISEIEKILKGEKLHNIILGHFQDDDLPIVNEIVKTYPDVVISISSKVDKNFAEKFPYFNFEFVESEDTISTGKYSFEFIHTPFIHTKAHMITYLNEEKILFSNDMFGSIIGEMGYFDKEYSLEYLMGPTRLFYGNVLLPRAKFIKKKIEEISEREIKVVCPSYGVIWKEYLNDIMVAYYSWSMHEKLQKAVLIYDSIKGVTEKMSNHVYKAFIDSGYEVKSYKLSEVCGSQIMAELIDAHAIAIGGSGYNTAMIPSMAMFLERMYAQKPEKIYGYVFGSFTEFQTHIKRIEARLQETGVEVIDTASGFIELNKSPEEKAYLSASEFALTIRQKIKA